MRSDNISGIIALSEYWLYECIVNHPGCYFDPMFGWSSDMPRRFVQLCDFAPGSAESLVKVVNNVGYCQQYAALTYTWQSQDGTKPPITLSGKSQSLLYAGFHPKCLSLNIQNACRLAKGMGLRYIWIDALVSKLSSAASRSVKGVLYFQADSEQCIMQDSDEDWCIEAAKMASIYMNAVFTIAALDAVDIETDITCFRTSIQDEDELQGRMYKPGRKALPEKIHSVLELSGNFISRPNRPWDTRGWTFQENLLSRRIISITTEGIFWNCSHHSASDQRPTGIPGDFSPHFRDTDDRAFRQLALSNNTLVTSKESRAATYWQWRRAVQDYTRRELTVRTDRPIAMGGITSRFSIILGDVSSYGIWQRDAVRSLLWFRDVQSARGLDASFLQWERLPGQPTWSWYSVSGPIQYRLRHPWDPHKDNPTEEFFATAEIRQLPTERNPRSTLYPEPKLVIRGAIRKAWLFDGRLYIRVKFPKHETRSSVTAEHDRNSPTASELLMDATRKIDQQHYQSSEYLADNGDCRDKCESLEEFDSHRALWKDLLRPGPEEIEKQPEADRPLKMYSLFCLLLGEGGYTQGALSAQFYLVLSPAPGTFFQSQARNLLTFPTWRRTGALHLQRIGVCVFDSRLVCKSSSPHKLECDDPETACICVNNILDVEIV